MGERTGSNQEEMGKNELLISAIEVLQKLRDTLKN
jgi:hypothetical protein